MFLNEEEVLLIEGFNKNEKLSEAVRKVLLAGIYSHGVIEAGGKHDPLQNGAFSLVSLAPTNPIPDEIIGQQLRAQWAGINALHNAFNELKKIKSTKAENEAPAENEGV
jgi:hypothetical protein